MGSRQGQSSDGPAEIPRAGGRYAPAARSPEPGAHGRGVPVIRTLDSGWTVQAVAGPVPSELVGRSVPATVPGCVHLDLLAAALIPDPYLDENEAALQWIGLVDWRYETTVHWDGHDPTEQVDLEALGLDTIAAIEVNGTVVGLTANMHRSYRFPVAALLHAGPNDVAITFSSAVKAAETASAALGPRPLEYPHPYNAIRKMACNFGWDWGPVLVTAGIWRPLRLHTWRTARIAAVRPLATVEAGTGLLEVHIDLQRSEFDRVPVTLEVRAGGHRALAVVSDGALSTVLRIAVAEAELWWPHGFGQQKRYPVQVLLQQEQEQLDDWSGQVGFRAIRLDTTADQDGTPFVLSVNDVPVFIRGANWIPDDCFLPRIDRDRYARRLQQARDANVNLLRVWGGGTYESDEFYDLCDELGLLVWQDFLFACAAYAEEEPLRSEVVAEATQAITRLSQYPSLVLWNGGNENIWGHQDWGWQDKLDGATWGWGYYTEILPALLTELDPTRPYSAGSPYSMSTRYHPNDPAHGTVHIWDVWNQLDYTAYRNYRPRFVSEFGFQGPPTRATLVRAIHDRPLTAESVGMMAHQKAQDGNTKLALGLRGHLPEPPSFDDWHWATSLNQARAVAYGVEHFRSLNPLCMGTIMWQFNDCWPVTSWAAVDGDGCRKPLWYALRRAYRDRLLTIQPRGEGLALIAVNDTAEPWNDVVQVTRRCFDGSVVADRNVRIVAAPRGVSTVALPMALTGPDDPTGELLSARGSVEQAWWHFVEDVDAALPEAVLDTRFESERGGYRLSVTARTVVRDLALLVDLLAPDAVVDDMLVTVLPGETAVFTVRTAAQLTAAQLTDRLVLRSANQLVNHRSATRVGR